VPSVASQPPALKPTAPVTPVVPAAAQSSAPASFESLLDDGAQAAAAPAPPPPSNKPSAPSAPPVSQSQAPAQRDGTTPAKTDGGTQTTGAPTGDGPQATSAQAKSNDGAQAVSELPKTDIGTQDANAPVQADKAILGAGITQPAVAQTNGTADGAAVAATQVPVPGVPAPTIQAPADTQASDNPNGNDDPKVISEFKADAKTTTQTAAAAIKPTDKGKPSDPAKATDDADADAAAAPSSDAGQPISTANVVVAVVAPVTAPVVTPGSATPAANEVVIAGDGAPKATAPVTLGPATPAVTAAGVPLTPQQGGAAPLQQTPDAKPVDDAKDSDKAAAPADGKPQPASPDKRSDAQTVTTSPADHQPAPLTTGVHTADAKTPDTAVPPPAATAQPQTAAPAQTTAQAAATPQPLPQAAAIPVSGLGIEIAGRALAGKNRFEIRLDPPELGRIEVRLDVDKDGRITSHVIADRRDTLDLLQRDASGLQRALQDSGLKTADNGLQFSLRDHSAGQQQQQQQQNSSPATPGTAQLVVEDDVPLAPSAYSPLAGLAGGLDIRV